MKQRDQNVYIMFDTEDYKLGYAYDVIRRMKNIQGANKNAISIIHVIKTNDMYKLEADLKKVLKSFKIRGEWYRIPDYILDSLLKIVTMNPTDYSYNHRLHKLHARVKTWHKQQSTEYP